MMGVSDADGKTLLPVRIDPVTNRILATATGIGSGSVTSVSVTTANGVSGSVATPTTTPAISLTLGAITPSSVNGVALSGTSTPTLAVTGTTAVSGSNTGDQTNITGNAATATKLATSRLIADHYFDGTDDISIVLDDISDVAAPFPDVDDHLKWNGSNWVNAPMASSATSGITFWNATPVITSRTSPGGISQDGTAGNGIQINSLSLTPVVTAEQTQAGQAVSDTRAFSAWKLPTALGVTQIPSGEWNFITYCSVNSLTAGRVTTLNKTIYQVVVPSSGTVTVTGTGNSRTATASTGTPFATGGYFNPSATNTVASYLYLPSGIYQITGRTSNTVVTITVPTGYANESTVAFDVWNKLISAVSPAITAVGTNYSASFYSAASAAFVMNATDKLGSISFVTSNNTTTLTVAYDGIARNSDFVAPLLIAHNDLPGLQGGTGGERYHLTSDEYAGSGTGVFARVSSPVFTTPNIGTATGSITGNAATVTGFTAGAGTLTGPATSGTAVTLGNAETVTGAKTMSSVLFPAGATLNLNATPSSAGCTGNTTNAFNSGYTSTAVGDLVYLDSSATFQKCDNATSSTTYSGMLAIALTVAASGAAVTVALPGSYVFATAWNLATVGAKVYMGTSAGLTLTAPTTTDTATRIIGYVVASGNGTTKIFFQPDPSYVVHS